MRHLIIERALDLESIRKPSDKQNRTASARKENPTARQQSQKDEVGAHGTSVRGRNQLHRRLRRGVCAFLHVVLRIIIKARFERLAALLSFHVDK